MLVDTQPEKLFIVKRLYSSAVKKLGKRNARKMLVVENRWAG